MKTIKGKILIVLILIFGVVTYGYSQYLKKGLISAVLQQGIDLNSPQGNLVFAISTFDQKTPDGKNIPKGTKFTGKLNKEENKLIIYFDTLEMPEGKKQQFLAKTVLNINEKQESNGVSAKIGKTLYQQSKTNVLGAIFHTSSNISQSLLPQGSILKLELN